MLKLSGFFFGLILGLVIFGCHGSDPLPDSSEEFVPPSVLDDHPQIILTDKSPDQLPGRGTNVTQARISGNLLILTVQYSGGGVKHDYSCYVNTGTFSDSSPEQAELYLRDNAPADMGLMIVTETLVFDLLNVADIYHGWYDFFAPFELKIYYSGPGGTAKPIVVTYDPR